MFRLFALEPLSLKGVLADHVKLLLLIERLLKFFDSLVFGYDLIIFRCSVVGS